MKELRAAQAARAAGKSESDVVKAGVAAGKPTPKPATPSPGASQAAAAARPMNKPTAPAVAKPNVPAAGNSARPTLAPKVTAPAVAKPAAPKPMSRIAKATSNIKPMVRSEHLEDLMDYLLDEGYVDNIESAQVMAQHMSDDWINTINE